MSLTDEIGFRGGHGMTSAYPCSGHKQKDEAPDWSPSRTPHPVPISRVDQLKCTMLLKRQSHFHWYEVPLAEETATIDCAQM